MFVCPRCRTSNIRNCHSLLIHLARYCTGPTLPSNAFTTSTLTSRIPHRQHPLSMATTSLQQARHFNAPEVNIALPPINTLYAMPSITQLSSTPTNITQSNLRNSDSDNVMIIPIVLLSLVLLTYLSRNVLSRETFSAYHLMLRFRFIV